MRLVLFLLAASSLLAAAPSQPAQTRALAAPDDSLVARGRRTFDAICSGCHTLQPPPLKAPPMVMIAARYRAATADRAAMIRRVAAWPLQPDTQRALLPPMMIRHWGLMPALPLPAQDLDAVGHFLAALAYDSAGTAMHGPGMRGMRGMGMGMHMRRGGRGVMQHRDTLPQH